MNVFSGLRVMGVVWLNLIMKCLAPLSLTSFVLRNAPLLEGESAIIMSSFAGKH